MSDWEEFCDANGWNAGSEDDYDEFLDSLEDLPRKFTYSKIQPRRGGTDYFSTFEQASQWSKTNGGKAFTRSRDGSGFVPVTKDQFR